MPQGGGLYAYELNPGEGAFYGPKLEFVLTDAIGRDWQCGTLQVDFNLPERLDASYIGEDGAKHRPVMLHRATLGSFERFIGILIETMRASCPSGWRRVRWWWPPSCRTPIPSCRGGDGADARGVRAEADMRNEKINYKVREHSVGKVPVILAIGMKEVEERTVSVRRLGETRTRLPAAPASATSRSISPPAGRSRPVGWLEIHAENYMGDGGRPLAQLRHLAERFPMSVHGVGLSIGGEGPLDADHLARLKRLCDWLQPASFSEHLAWSTHDGAFLNDLLPLPYTDATLARVADHIDQVQEVLGRRMLLENPSTYLAFAETEMVRGGFPAEIARRTGCGLLLDVNNVFVSATNLGLRSARLCRCLSRCIWWARSIWAAMTHRRMTTARRC
jgi:hypothetical protein